MERVVIITGGDSGIGKQTANLFKQSKDIVYILDKTEKKEENYYTCDVSNEHQVKEIICEIGLKHRKIDIVINCAGYGVSGALELIDTKTMEGIFDVNTKGTYIVTKYAIKYMTKGSKIINIASACALFALPYRGLYCASKSAVNMLSLSFNMELKPLGIDVCSICPGDVKTNFTKNRVKIFETNERYGNRIANAAYSIDKNHNKRMDADVVAKAIFKVANKRKVKPMKIVSGKIKFLYFISKFIPLSLFIKLTEKFFGGHKEYKDNPYLTNNN